MAELESPLKKFLADKLCLIVEPSQSFAFAIQTSLQQMGIPHAQLYIARKVSDAKKIITEKKPKILITEYEIDGSFAMDLIELQSKQYELPERISFITTMNASDSAVAEASEGEVDGYLLKPFAMNMFQQKMEQIMTQKLNPSEYLTKINIGKRYFAKNEFEKAVTEFLESKPLHEKPTLACFHAGQTFQALGDMTRALAEYQEGRKFHPLHYRCLIGEFEALLSVKNYAEAYSLIEPLQKNYPITARRLGHFFVAAVFTNHFDDLPGFYKLFSRLDQRTPELVKISSMALLTAGRFFLKEKNLDKALEYFDLGLLIAGRDFDFLEKTANEFIKLGSGSHAFSLFKKAATADINTRRYLLLEFSIGQLIWAPDEIIEKGKKLVNDNLGTPEIFEAVVKAMAELGKEILAGTFISKVSEKESALANNLYRVLEKNLKKTPQSPS